MQIDWPRYVKTAKEQGLTGIEVVGLIQKETNRKVNISEVKRVNVLCPKFFLKGHA